MLEKIFLVTAAAAIAVQSFDHEYTAYGRLLSEYVSGGGVLYEKLAGDTRALGEVKAVFESADRKQFDAFTEEQQIAFLINAYNFYTLDLIVQNLPLKIGIQDIASPWKIEFIPFLGQKVSLDHIEHEILRKDYAEPRIHFALVCASISCPELENRPFIADSLDKMLNFTAKKFLADTTRNRVGKGTLHLSKIFEWYGKDFDTTHKGGYREYIGEVLGIDTGRHKIRFMNYDWGLNRAGISSK